MSVNRLNDVARASKREREISGCQLSCDQPSAGWYMLNLIWQRHSKKDKEGPEILDRMIISIFTEK
jgi:hypothetical protein